LKTGISGPVVVADGNEWGCYVWTGSC
jgi:hypothetical protein